MKREIPDAVLMDAEAEIERLAREIRAQVTTRRRRRGVVLGLSGGVESSVCAALCARALGRERVFGLLLPGPDSSSDGERLGRLLAESIGIDCAREDIAPILEAAGCHRRRGAAARFRHRVRRMMEYYYADLFHYAVVGDGAADLKPIAHLCSGHVHRLAEALGVPPEITGS